MALHTAANTWKNAVVCGHEQRNRSACMCACCGNLTLLGISMPHMPSLVTDMYWLALGGGWVDTGGAVWTCEGCTAR